MIERSNLRVLRGKSEPREDVVTLARSLLEKAERGDIISLAAAYEYRNGDGGFWIAHGEQSAPGRLVGEVEVMKGAIVKKMLDENLGSKVTD